MEAADNELARVPELTNRMLVGIAGTIAGQWEKFTGWLITGLAATLALIIANIDKAKDMLQVSSVSLAIKIFILILLVHTVQKVLAIAVGSAAVGTEKSLLKPPEAPPTKAEALALMSNVEAAYFPPFSWMIRGMMARLKNGEITHVGIRIVRLALCSALLAALQVLMAIWCVAVIASGLS